MPKKKKIYFVWIVVILIVFGSSATYAVKATSSNKFCSEVCHEMGVNAEEMKFSTHFSDYDGAEITCVQCHVPIDNVVDSLVVKVYSGAKDIYVSNFGDPQNLNRLNMQKVARRFVSDANCLACHEDLYKDAKKQNPISELGKIAHDAYNGKNGQAKSNCVGCHQNLAHLPTFDKRYVVNESFSSRINNQEAYKQ